MFIVVRVEKQKKYSADAALKEVNDELFIKLLQIFEGILEGIFSGKWQKEILKESPKEGHIYILK